MTVQSPNHSFGLKFQHACEGLRDFAETLVSKAARQLDKLEAKVIYAFTKTQWETNQKDFAKLEADVRRLDVFIDQHPGKCSFAETNALRQGLREMKNACRLLKGPSDQVKAKQANVARLYDELTTIEGKITGNMQAALFKPKAIKTAHEEPVRGTRKEEIGKCTVDDIGIRETGFVRTSVTELMRAVQELKTVFNDKYNLRDSLVKNFGTTTYSKLLNDLLSQNLSEMNAGQLVNHFDIILKIFEQGLVAGKHGVLADENKDYVVIDEKSKPDLHKAYNHVVKIYNQLANATNLNSALKELMAAAGSHNENLGLLLEQDVLSMSTEQIVKHFDQIFDLIEKGIVEAKLGVFSKNENYVIIKQSQKKLLEALERAVNVYNELVEIPKSKPSPVASEATKKQSQVDYAKERAKIGEELNDFVIHLKEKYPLVASLGKYWGERSTDNARLVFLLGQNFEKMNRKDVVASAREILTIIRRGMHYDQLKKEIYIDDHNRMAELDRLIKKFEKDFVNKK